MRTLTALSERSVQETVVQNRALGSRFAILRETFRRGLDMQINVYVHSLGCLLVFGFGACVRGCIH